MASNNVGSESNSESKWVHDELCSVTNRAGNVDASRRALLASTGAGILGALFSGTGAVGAQDDDALNAKTRTTLRTEEDRANAQRNIERYDWAENQRDSAVEAAEAHLERWGPDLDSLWNLVTSQEIPRGGGLRVERRVLRGFYDSQDERLWKIKTTVDNPNGDGKLTVPTNDFEAYRESGLDDRGMFDPDLADDQYLVNEEHPEMGEGWGVDDGYGWVDEDDDLGGGAGNRWKFVAYHNHWFTWRPGGILGLIRVLTDAYLLTGDQKYSRAGAVLLDRIADVYPEMNISPYSMSGFWNSTGGVQTGKVLGAFWEDNLMRPIVRAYDAFFPGMEGDDELVAFLDGKTEEFPGLDDKDSVEKIRKNIEDGIHREILPAAENADLWVGSGSLSTVTQSARVLDEPDGYTREALEWVFKPGRTLFVGDTWNEEPEKWIVTGGNILAPLVDEADRDGYWNRTAVGYNRIPQNSIREVADYLKGYDAFDGADLYQHPKLRQSLLQNSHLLLLDEHTPEIGDEQSPTGSAWNQTGVEEGFKLTGESIYAQLWHYSNGYSTTGISGSIYDADPEGLDDEVQAIIDAEGPLDLPSQNLAGYGFAALRDGENHTIGSPGIKYDTSNLFVDATATVNDSFDEAIQFEPDEPGDWWEFDFDVPADDEYDVEIEALFGPSTYGIYELYINGEILDTIDFYADGSGRDFLTYRLDLPEGISTMRFEVIDKNNEASDYNMALYYLSLFDEAAREEKRQLEELGNAKRAFWMYYGRNSIDAGGSSHAHADTLNLGVSAHEMELSPELGYPEQTGSWPKRHNWTNNTISHNTVTVDESKQDPIWVATPRHFDGDDERVNLIDVDARHAYRHCDEYRRTTAMIEVDEEHSYAVDFFHVEGGEDHLFSFHGTEGEATAEGVDLVAQDGGTYAGENVPKPGYGEDSEYNQEVGSGFNYLTDVERDDDPGERVVVDWDLEDPWNHRDDDAEGVHMRLTSFGDFDEVALADGHLPELSGNPETFRYALLRRQGSDLESTFVSAIEHYDGERAVESVEQVPVEDGEGHAVKVELENGRTDYVVCTFDEDDTVTVDGTFEFKGFFGVYSVEDGEPEYAYVHDGTRLRPKGEQALVKESRAQVRGFVEDFTREMSLENEVDVRLGGKHTDQLDRHAGFVYVDNDDSNPWRTDPDPKEPIAARSQRGLGNGAYPIEDISEGGDNVVSIDVGPHTFTRDFVDSEQLEEGGYHYIIDEDDDVRIPLTSTWSRD